MKKILPILFIISVLATATRAAVLVGTDIGYLADRKETYYTGRVGLELNTTPSYVHELDVEIGYTRSSEAGCTRTFSRSR
jgi:hypothetical protein